MDARAIFAGLFVFLFAAGLSSYIVLNNVAAVATDSGFWTSALESAGMYDALYNSVLEKISGGGISDAQIAAVKQDLPVSEFKVIINSTIAQLIDYLTGRREALPVLSAPSIMGVPARDIGLDEMMGGEALQQMRSVVMQFFALLGLLLLGAVVAFAIALALGRGTAGRIALAGKALITSGAFSLLSCLFILAIPLVLLSAIRTALPQQIASIAEPLIGEFISRVFLFTLISTIVLLAIGVSLFLLGRRMKKRQP